MSKKVLDVKDYHHVIAILASCLDRNNFHLMAHRSFFILTVSPATATLDTGTKTKVTNRKPLIQICQMLSRISLNTIF